MNSFGFYYAIEHSDQWRCGLYHDSRSRSTRKELSSFLCRGRHLVHHSEYQIFDNFGKFPNGVDTDRLSRKLWAFIRLCRHRGCERRSKINSNMCHIVSSLINKIFRITIYRKNGRSKCNFNSIGGFSR